MAGKWRTDSAHKLPGAVAFVYLSKTLYAFCLPLTNNSNKQRGTGTEKCPDPGNSIEIAACGCDLMGKCVFVFEKRSKIIKLLAFSRCCAMLAKLTNRMFKY